MNSLEDEIRKQEQEGFDIDAITEADLDEPPRLPALYSLAALIRRPELLPPGYVVEPLGSHEYKLAMPGMRAPLRITTSAAFFEEHPGSAELWSPGSPLFPAVEEAGADRGNSHGPLPPLSSVLAPRGPSGSP